VDKRKNWSTALGLCAALVGFVVMAADDFSAIKLLGEFAERKLQRDVGVATAGTTVHWVLPSSLN